MRTESHFEIFTGPNAADIAAPFLAVLRDRVVVTKTGIVGLGDHAPAWRFADFGGAHGAFMAVLENYCGDATLREARFVWIHFQLEHGVGVES